MNKDVDYYIRPIQSEFHIVSESWQSDNAIKPYAVEVEFDNNNTLLPFAAMSFFEKGRKIEGCDLTKLWQKLTEMRDLLRSNYD